VAYDGSQKRKPGLRTVRRAVEDCRALATVLAMEAEAILGRRTARFLGLLALFAVVVGTLLFLLDWYIAPDTSGERKDLILTLAQILGGAALLTGLYFTWRTLQVNREGQITDRFTRAIEQLGATSDEEKKGRKVEIRVGGIYALERIARDSERDCWTIVRVLSAYIRENAPGLGGALSNDERREIIRRRAQYMYPQYQHEQLDIQAALDVIKVLLEQCERQNGKRAGRPLYLNNTDLSFGDFRQANLEEASIRNAKLVGIRLRGANLRKAHLRTSVLMGADLRETNFEGADLEEVNFELARLNKATFGKATPDKLADLRKTNFEGANLQEVTFKGVDLREATFKGANLQKATFKEADLWGATVSDATLHGADLRGAKNLTQPKLEETSGDETTLLPSNLKPPMRWRVQN
jgi:hypothetical protein